MTFVCEMPSQARCERVPPAHGWDLDMRLLQEDTLPIDPRAWCRATVARWVSHHGGDPRRFPMNGKALCLMTQDMFAARVPHRGHKLHADFRRRLAKALALQEWLEKMNADELNNI